MGGQVRRDGAEKQGGRRWPSFPAALAPGQPLDVIRHHGAQGFMDADVMTVPAAPGLILLERRSS
ncbi:hypothetical protein ACFHYO_15260 [Paracoccus panacisoli]|uniref:Uncharacterized protein n=1 Tax=Paracoccus panacisoli TaxID=1510163 RepID=A0ABV6T862_9RHOB